MKNESELAIGFNPTRLTNKNVGEGWVLLNENDPIREGDGFLHPHYHDWMDYNCRPDIFRGCIATNCPKKEFVHTWSWRRRA